VVVSVPAGDGWAFTRRLLAAFTERVTAVTASWPAEVQRTLPTVSAGLVFHHRSAPFIEQATQARRMLRDAKAHGRGLAATVAFLDATADGSGPPPGRVPLSAAELDGRADQLAAAAALPASTRATLLGLARIAEQEDPAAGAAERTATIALARQATAARTVLWEVVANTPAPDGGAVHRLLLGDAAARHRLRNTLDLARWWPAVREPAEAGAR
jgi:hypothetical protein